MGTAGCWGLRVRMAGSCGAPGKLWQWAEEPKWGCSGMKLCVTAALALRGESWERGGCLYLVAGAALAACSVVDCGNVCWCFCVPASSLWIDSLALNSTSSSGAAEIPSQSLLWATLTGNPPLCALPCLSSPLGLMAKVPDVPSLSCAWCGR